MGNLLFSFFLAVLLSCTFFFPVWGLAERLKGRRRVLSAAAGSSIAYIFIMLMPEIEKAGAAFRQEGVQFLPQQGTYMVNAAMMLGFVFSYALGEIMPARESPDRLRRYKRGFWVQVAGYGAYIALIGYLLVHSISGEEQTSRFYALSMFLHFLLIAFAFRDAHGENYDRIGCFFLSGSCIVGWLLGSLLSLHTVILIPLFGFVCGGMVSVTGRVELPKGEEGRAVPFISGALGYALFLVLFA